MFSRALARLQGSSGALARSRPLSSSSAATAVPNCLCSHGKDWVFHYMNHPGVMAVSTLVELNGVVKMRANFTPETIDAMKVITNSG